MEKYIAIITHRGIETDGFVIYAKDYGFAQEKLFNYYREIKSGVLEVIDGFYETKPEWDYYIIKETHLTKINQGEENEI